jgi:hypothetical protein
MTNTEASSLKAKCRDYLTEIFQTDKEAATGYTSKSMAIGDLRPEDLERTVPVSRG